MTTTRQADMANPRTTKAVVKAPGKDLAKDMQKRFIDILLTDHSYDIVKEIVDHIRLLKRTKKMKAKDKNAMIKDYNLTLLAFCVPKQKIVEDRPDDSGKGVVFNINLGGPEPEQTKSKTVKSKASKPKTGINITIPTRQADDGTYSIDESQVDS